MYGVIVKPRRIKIRNGYWISDACPLEPVINIAYTSIFWNYILPDPFFLLDKSPFPSKVSNFHLSLKKSYSAILIFLHLLINIVFILSKGVGNHKSNLRDLRCVAEYRAFRRQVAPNGGIFGGCLFSQHVTDRATIIRKNNQSRHDQTILGNRCSA